MIWQRSPGSKVLPSIREVLFVPSTKLIRCACNSSTAWWREVAVGRVMDAEGSEVQYQCKPGLHCMDYNVLVINSEPSVMHWCFIKEGNKSTSPCLAKRESRSESSSSCFLCLSSSVCLLYVSESVKLIKDWIFNLSPCHCVFYMTVVWLYVWCTYLSTKSSALCLLNSLESIVWEKEWWELNTNL